MSIVSLDTSKGSNPSYTFSLILAGMIRVSFIFWASFSAKVFLSSGVSYPPISSNSTFLSFLCNPYILLKSPYSNASISEIESSDVNLKNKDSTYSPWPPVSKLLIDTSIFPEPSIIFNRGFAALKKLLIY